MDVDRLDRIEAQLELISLGLQLLIDKHSQATDIEEKLQVKLKELSGDVSDARSAAAAEWGKRHLSGRKSWLDVLGAGPQ